MSLTGIFISWFMLSICQGGVISKFPRMFPTEFSSDDAKKVWKIQKWFLKINLSQGDI